MTVALIDGDIVAYRAACVGQEEDPFGQPGDLEYNPQKAMEAADYQIRYWTKGAKADRAVVIFSGPDVFRYSILPTYKSNRTGEKPKLLGAVVANIEKNWKTNRKDHLEADDTIGILASSDPSKYVAVSIDKDFVSIPGRVFNPDRDAIPRTIRPAMADRTWLMQTLMGDAVDGYKGCPGIGAVKAAKILDEAGFKTPAMWAAVVQAFADKGLSEDDALVQARVARILRHTDFDNNTREIILWHPRQTERLSPHALKGVASVAVRSSTEGDPGAVVPTTLKATSPTSRSLKPKRRKPKATL